MNREELASAAAQIRWYHQMDLGMGIKTGGLYDPAAKLSRYGLPADLSSKSVLDIGAWDGFWSFEAERRKAARVLATDSFVWSGQTWGSKEGFELARRALNSKVEDLEIDVLDLTTERIGTFDLVLFLGVLYHMRHPMLALDRVFSVTREMLILETEVDLLHIRRPAMAFYPGRELNDDPTNWIGPNPAAVKGMLHAAGFSRVEIFGEKSLPYQLAKYVVQRRRKRGNRMVFHAWR